jgi:hypothetical protein
MTNCHVSAEIQSLAMYQESFENLPFTVTPAKAGVQKVLKRLDTGFRRYDDLRVSAEIQSSHQMYERLADHVRQK